MNMFTSDNTNGFSQFELIELNRAADIIAEQTQFDRSKVCDIVSNLWLYGDTADDVVRRYNLLRRYNRR